MNVKILGKVIGIADYWDEITPSTHIFYNFKASYPNLMWAEGSDLIVDYWEGYVSAKIGPGHYQNMPIEWKI